jgi:hypothetical protein
MLLLLRTFLGLFDRLLKFQDALHDLHEGIRSLTAAVALLSNGCFSAETLL